MYKKEEIQDFLEKFKEKSNVVSTATKISEAFNYYVYLEINNINSNYKTFDHNKWKEIYEKNKNEPAVILQLLKTGNCPIEIVCDIVETHPFITGSKKVSYSNSNIYGHILKEALNYNLTEKHFNSIFASSTKDFIVMYDSKLAKENEPRPASTDLKAFIKYLVINIEDITSVLMYSYPDSIKKLFSNLTDVDLCKKIGDLIDVDCAGEIIRSGLICNKYLDMNNPDDVEFVDKLFNNGYDITTSHTKNFTPMLINFYKDNIFNLEDSLSLTEKKKRIALINDLLYRKVLPASLEYDFAMKVKDLEINDKAKQNLISSLYSNTDLPDLFKEIPSLPIDIKRTVLLMNRNIPEKIYFDVCCDVFDKAFKSKKSKPIPQTKLDDLKTWSHCATFRDKDYDFLIEKYINERELFFEISNSNKTPIKHLDKIIEKFEGRLSDSNSTEVSKSFDVRTIALALSTKGFLEGKINEREYNFLTNRLLVAEFALEINDYDRMNNFKYSIMGYKETLKKIIDDRKDENFVNVVRQIFGCDKESYKYANYLKVFCDYLEQRIIPFVLDHSDTRKPVTQDNIAHLSDDRIEFETKTLYNQIAIMGNSLMESETLLPNFYIELNDFIEKYNLITTEKERRDSLTKNSKEIER